MTPSPSLSPAVTAEFHAAGLALTRLPGERSGTSDTRPGEPRPAETATLDRAVATAPPAPAAPSGRRYWRPRRMTAKAMRRRMIREQRARTLQHQPPRSDG